MGAEHISQDRLLQIVETGAIKIDEWVHVRECETCNQRIRTCVARARDSGKNVKFGIPPLVVS